MRISTEDGFNYSVLNALTAQIDDLETLRIAVSNRHRLLVKPRDEADEDGIARGLGLDPDDLLVVAPVRVTIDGIVELESRAVKAVEKYMRLSPWAAWLASPDSRGVGAKQLARLLGATGDPAWNDLHGRERRMSELWSYCGYAVVDGAAPARRTGQKANWSQDARKRAWLIAGSCLKSGGPFREVYDAVKEIGADAVHGVACARCTPKGAPPAEPGTPLKPAHLHGRGMRAMAKEVLRQVFREARRHRGLNPLPETATV